MKFYFAWAQDGSPFDPIAHAREDLKIFALKITEEEGAYAHACLTVPKKKSAFESYAHISVSQADGEPKALFSGRLVDCPTRLDGEMITIEMIGTCRHREAALLQLKNDHQNTDEYNPLFTPLFKRSQPEWSDLLLGCPKLPYVSRIGREVKLCTLDSADHFVPLNDKFYRNSLQVKFVQAPYDQVKVELKAHWVQNFMARTCLDSVLQRHSGARAIRTFLPKQFEESWWQADQSFGETGYKVIESRLEPLNTPRETLNLQISGQRPIPLRAKAYRPGLTVEWQYVQPRCETVELSLKNKCQSMALKPLRTKCLQFNLGNVAEPYQIPIWGADLYYERGDKVEVANHIYEANRSHRSRASFQEDQEIEWNALGEKQAFPLQSHQGTFFTTETGHRCVEHAIEIARCYLAASTRSVELRLTCALEDALDWHTDSLIHINDDRLDGGQAQGKVKRLVFEVCGQKGLFQAHVTVACSIGQGEENQEERQEDRDLESDASLKKTRSGLKYRPFHDQLPRRGMTFPHQLGASDIIRDIFISNDAEAQREQVNTWGPLASENDARLMLKGIQTRIKLRLEDLRSTKVLDHKIIVEVPQAWTGPKHLSIAS